MTRPIADLDVELMLEHDGERDTHVEIPDSDEVGLKRQALADVSEVMRTYYELEADDAAGRLDGLWERIEQGLDARDVVRSSERETTPGTGFVQRVVDWLGVHRGHFVTGAVTAAVVMLVVLTTGPKANDGKRTVIVPPEPATLAPVSAPPASTPPEIESLEVYQGSGTILSLPGEDGEAPSAVIWLTPADAEETLEGPI